MSITTFRLAREQEEALLQAEVKAEVVEPAPETVAEVKKPAATVSKPKTTTVKG